jgi:hypothetical protein
MLMPMRLRVLLLGLMLAPLAATLPAGRLAAQVGHDPRHSPYRDIAQGNSLTVMGGRFLGSGGSVGVGPHSGWTYGLRWDFRAGGPVSFGLGVDRGNLERLYIDPFQPESRRTVGTLSQQVTVLRANLQLNLTGGKTWNHLAPFVALSGGLAFAQRTPADTSGFNFGNRFVFAPNAGVRIFLSDRLHLRGQANATFWKIKYPLSFRQANPAPAVLLDARQSEWVVSPWIQFGLGYTL